MVAVQRTEDIQKGIDEYLEAHKDEIRQIYTLEPAEREKEFSRLMERELNYISIMGKHNPKRERDTQIMVAMETDRILELDSVQQQQVIKEKYGLDPKEVMDHYPELQTKAHELQQRMRKADRYLTAFGWTAAAATATALLVKMGNSARSLSDRISMGNKLVKWFIVPMASIAAGFVTSITATGLFGNIRNESSTLVARTRNILEDEVSDAVDHAFRAAIEARTVSQDAMTPELRADTERKIRIQSRDNYSAEIMKEKTAGQANATAIS